MGLSPSFSPKLLEVTVSHQLLLYVGMSGLEIHAPSRNLMRKAKK
uniref:Uncharacterized protein n=1 Tax=Vitis vinifera TaxID=29760 RepID=F6I073_VITVI